MTYEPSTLFQIPEAHYTALFNALPGNSVLLKADAPTYTILAVTANYARDTGTKREALIGVGIFEAFPANNADPNHTGESDMYASYQYVLEHREVHYLPTQRYDLKNDDGSYSERYWRASNAPVFSPDGTVTYIIHTAEDITHEVMSSTREAKMKGMEVVNNLFDQTPIPVCLLKGSKLVVELANEPTLQLWGKGREVIGLPLELAVPEVRGQGYAELISEVRETGITKQVYESPVTVIRNGKAETAYINYVYEPYYEEDKTRAAGVLAIGNDVTDKVLAKKQVQESEARYQTLFESMDQGFCVIEMIFDENTRPVDYRFLETNRVFENQTGLQDAAGKTARNLIPHLEQRWIDLYGNVAITGQSIRFTEGSAAMGRWFDVYAFQAGGSDSCKVALLFTDITERRKADDAIRRSEANLRNVLLQAPVAMAILRGPQFIVELANDDMYELWGRGKEELLGRSIFEGLPEVRSQGYEELLTNVYTTGERFTALGIPVTLPRDNAIETVYINLLYEAFREADGTISGVMAVAADVTEQVMARLRVEESNKELQFAIDVMPQMVWVTKPDGYHDLYNRQWYDYTGMSHEETKGEGWNSVLHPDDLQRTQKVWQRSLETGEPYQIEYRLKRYDGAYRWFLGRALPLRDEESNILKWFGTCTDVDDQRRAAEIMEQKVAERTMELKNANDQLKQFAYSASHDLQEPLRKISFFLDRLIHNIGSELSGDNQAIVQRIQHTTGRMRSLIEDLLAYSNTTLGATGFREVSLTDAVQDVLDDMEATIIEKGARITLHELPIIHGDERQLRQLFQNLISNAVKYHRKGVAPQIAITSNIVQRSDVEANIPLELRDKSYHLIEVKDNGIGFDPDDAERIFRLFQRLHGKAEYEGSGVGLAIVQKVVENHEGYIWAESAPGKGASFKILLPANS